MITVKVAKVPGMVREVVLENGATVADAILSADIDADGCSTQIDGVDVTHDTTLVNGQTILIVKSRVKGA